MGCKGTESPKGHLHGFLAGGPGKGDSAYALKLQSLVKENLYNSIQGGVVVWLDVSQCGDAFNVINVLSLKGVGFTNRKCLSDSKNGQHGV